MQALEVWKHVTADKSDFLDRLLGVLRARNIRFCVIGGQGVNAYAEPLVSLDLDLVVAADQLAEVEAALEREFSLKRFPHSINVSAEGSKLRLQIQTDPRYFEFPARATEKEVLGVHLPVAAVEDVLQGKIWAALDPARRPSKRRKDLLDIERLLEAFPGLREQVPAEILTKLV